MTDDPDEDSPSVPVVCPECETTTKVSIPDLADTIARHNEQLHDGENVAEVDPEVADRIIDLVAEDLGL